MMTSSSFDFRVYLKNIFALEPPLKPAMFVVEEVIYQNVKIKVKKIRYFLHIKFSKNVFKDFFHIQRSNDNSRNKIRFSAQF